jgi:hypothetical protein
MTAAVWGEGAGLSLAERVRQAAAPATALAGGEAGQVLPVDPALARLLPGGGLRRGSTVAVEGSASLLFAVLAEASKAGSWCAVVGVPGLGAVAAAEAGVATERLALVPRPGTDLAGVVAALVDGMDVVVVGGTARLSAADGRRLAARARQRGAVLMPYGPWHGADLELSCAGGRWRGLGTGHGHLRSREVTVQARGRGAASRPRTTRVLLPAPTGELTPAAVLAPAAVPSGGAVGRVPAPRGPVHIVGTVGPDRPVGAVGSGRQVGPGRPVGSGRPVVPAERAGPAEPVPAKAG